PMQPGRYAPRGLQPEVKILEKAKQQQVHRDRHDEVQLSPSRLGSFHGNASSKANQRGEGHQTAEFIVPATVKDVPRNGQPHVSLVSLAEFPKHEVRDGKKSEKELCAIKEHTTPLTSYLRRSLPTHRGQPRYLISHAFLILLLHRRNPTKLGD